MQSLRFNCRTSLANVVAVFTKPMLPVRYGLCAIAVGALIFVCYRIVGVNATTAALLLLLLVLAAATRWGLAEAIFTSVVAVFGFNYYFLPPIGTLRIS